MIATGLMTEFNIYALQKFPPRIAANIYLVMQMSDTVVVGAETRQQQKYLTKFNIPVR